MKSRLIDEVKLKKEDVVIKWAKSLVTYKKKEVAWVTTEGVLTTVNEADQVKQAVEEYMKSWKEKRGVEE